MIKKLILLMMILMMTACNFKVDNIVETSKYQRYLAYYTSIFDNDRFILWSNFYDIELVMHKLPNNQYRYDLIIDNPRIAMYDIEIMVVENNVTPELTDKMMPNLGIFEDMEYNFVPFQVNVEKGYPLGLVVSGVTDSSIVSLKVMISWKDYAKVKSTREFFDLVGDYEKQFITDHDDGGDDGDDESLGEPDENDVEDPE